MDQRLYTYDYRRPRLNNPTYNSVHVSNSLALFANQFYRYPEEMSNARQPYHLDSQPRPAGYVNKSLDTSYKRSYTNHYGPQSPRMQKITQQMDQRNRSGSRLSDYGTNMLKEGVHLPISHQDIYKKQQKQFNIINLQKKEHDEYIHKYPRLSKEDFQKRYVGDSHPISQQMKNQQFNYMPIAGMPAYGPRKGTPRNQQQSVNPKTLKNVDEFYM